MEYLLSALTGYLLGSIPTAYLLLKKTRGIDITAEGSGNVGAMNSYEITNSKVTGLIVLLIDALKGLLSVYLCLLFFPVNFIYPALALTFAVLSHCFNPWLGLKGGRGLATAAGGSILLFPFMLVIWLVIWLIIYLLKKDILFANVWAIIMTVIIVFTSSEIAFKYTYPAAATVGSLIMFTTSMSIIIFVKHIEPIKEIFQTKKVFRKGDINE